MGRGSIRAAIGVIAQQVRQHMRKSAKVVGALDELGKPGVTHADVDTACVRAQDSAWRIGKDENHAFFLGSSSGPRLVLRLKVDPGLARNR